MRGYTGYEEHARASRTAREVASADVTLIFSFGPSLTITDPRDGSVVERTSFVAGIHDGHVVTESQPHQHGVQVTLTPLGAYAVLGGAASGLANRTVALDDALGDDAARLAERLRSLPDWDARFRHLDRVFAAAFDDARAPSPTTAWVWRRLDETSGRISIRTLAEELGCSRKHIADRFRDEIGVPPKKLARLLRFGRASGLLRRGGIGLADIAYRCGYSDQAHFNREFRGFAGATPGEFAARAAEAPIGS